MRKFEFRHIRTSDPRKRRGVVKLIGIRSAAPLLGGFERSSPDTRTAVALLRGREFVERLTIRIRMLLIGTGGRYPNQFNTGVEEDQVSAVALQLRFSCMTARWKLKLGCEIIKNPE